jgi:hypothetical protein
MKTPGEILDFKESVELNYTSDYSNPTGNTAWSRVVMVL